MISCKQLLWVVGYCRLTRRLANISEIIDATCYNCITYKKLIISN